MTTNWWKMRFLCANILQIVASLQWDRQEVAGYGSCGWMKHTYRHLRLGDRVIRGQQKFWGHPCIVEIITQKKQQPPDKEKLASHDRPFCVIYIYRTCYTYMAHIACRKYFLRLVLQPVMPTEEKPQRNGACRKFPRNAILCLWWVPFWDSCVGNFLYDLFCSPWNVHVRSCFL